MSRIPTEWPASDSESASWVVMDDLPTPPLPESIWGILCEYGVVVVRGEVGRIRAELTSTMCLTLSRDIPLS